MSNTHQKENVPDLKACLEALLFVAPEAVSVSQLAATLDISPAEVEDGLSLLALDLQEQGLRLQRHAGRIQLTTAPEMADLVERFLGLEFTSHLSQAALEVLAIVAHEQPVTRPHIDSIRGVNSDGVMKNLLLKELIQDVGRADGPGRPILYATTAEFLHLFGLGSLDELPPLAPDLESEEENTPDENSDLDSSVLLTGEQIDHTGDNYS
jgi:segregation and condensation protein B